MLHNQSFKCKLELFLTKSSNFVILGPILKVLSNWMELRFARNQNNWMLQYPLFIPMLESKIFKNFNIFFISDQEPPVLKNLSSIFFQH